jgi:hypothetical protein
MIAQNRGGKVVFTSSARGKLGHPAGYSAYCASKSAVDGMTKALGCEWGKYRITVNAIAPTVFRSPLTAWMFEDNENANATRAGFLARVPIGRLGEPEDLAGPLLCFVLAGVRFSYRPHRLRRRRLYRRLNRMTSKSIIGIIGGGLMGAGIAHVFAGAATRFGYSSRSREARESLRDRVRAALVSLHQDEALADNVTPCEDLGEAVSRAGYVTEAAPEKLELKRAIFADLVRLAPPSAILASNTSVIPIHRIAGGVAHRGTHHRYALVESGRADPLVEVVTIGANLRGHGAHHHGTVGFGGKISGTHSEGCARIRSQSTAARAVAGSDCHGRRGHLRCRDARRLREEQLRIAVAGLGSSWKMPTWSDWISRSTFTRPSCRSSTPCPAPILISNPRWQPGSWDSKPARDLDLVTRGDADSA